MTTNDNEAGGLIDKIKNIDGKIGKEGKLREAMRGVAIDRPGTFVTSLGGIKEVNPNLSSTTVVNQSMDTGGEPKGNDALKEGSNSFASILKNPSIRANTKAVRLKVMKNEETVQGANVAIPLEAVKEVSSRFENTLYGYFIGHRLAFPLVENYVKNAWAKYGLERAML
ncbi:hypothetical protein Tco_1467396 [Tanacetum coccineum]